MQLKSIEIRGFKSFINKTELNFKEGITAIVGPNGSGKSNISDAIRWVLGEQSVKTLRGGKMEDVIFAGTQFRKPLGLAQVSLTLDNSSGELPLDYNDVTVSRRIYRSGDSEYYINNTQCRLKDIQELFMDTGIGKEGYSIIGQGKIDAILSGKPEERRSLLEEAAGIVKFKKRKEEGEKKLENTEVNLTRIKDILSTYEERLEPLEIESEKAKTFLNLSNELKCKEINIIMHSLDAVTKEIDSVLSNTNKFKEELNLLESKELNYKNDINNWNKKLEELDSSISKEKNQYYLKKEEENSLLNEINIIQERINNTKILIESSTKEIDTVEKKIQIIKESKDEEETKASNLQQDQKKLNGSIVEYETQIINLNSSIEEGLANIKKYKSEQIEILSSISNVNNQISIIENNIEILNNKKDNLKSSYESSINSLKINNNTAKIIDEELVKSSEKISEYETLIKKHKKEMDNFKGLLSENENKLRVYNNKYNGLEANYTLLTNLQNSYEGYNKSVKSIMGHISKGIIKEAYGNTFVLGEIIEVEKKYETAIEIALGASISHIITPDEKISRILIEHLKKNNLGRATFLPLNIIKGRSVNLKNNVTNIEGYLGIGSQLLKYNSKFKNAIEFALGRTIICNDMDSALNIAKVTDYSYKIVTLSGEVINVGGSLTGGSVSKSKNTSVIGRKREIEEMKENIDSLSISIKETQDLIATYRGNLKKLDEECMNLKDLIYGENIEEAKLKEKLSNIQNENIKLKNRLDVWNTEVEKIKEDIEKNKKSINEKTLYLTQLKSKEEENSNSIVNMEGSLKTFEEKINNFKDKLTEEKIRKAQIDEIIAGKLKELVRLDKEIDELNYKHLQLKENITKGTDNINEYIIKIDNNKLMCNTIDKLLKDLEETYKDKEIEIIKTKDNLNEIHSRLEENYILKNKKENEYNRLQVNLAKLESENNNLVLKLNEEIGLTLDEALDFKQDIEDISSYKKNINELKNKISSLGMVNVGAIEEYKEIKEKFTFLNSQKEDLTKAKEELLILIEELTNNMEKVFNDNFNILRKLFDETFKELFKGGSADLILSSEDVLNGNIEINVQPPGKKLQNINLMSGGEKVLSAIALLFAILKMKPTPFCILDEIEAALDDANVKRYADFLRVFSSNVQFIVITHRKGTMEASDVLYGVTMEEKGISKVISIDLKESAV
ncbi:chromosome segregation protein SMC [Clostridium sp. MSJ-11]|uniref:Chromosome partition protein Smc n=1 Tax=Clostridium mobile TaxID=2841512 RepID=A0ABS6EEB4_9CLOT|nr:chromosome segregation protein SMC [Clostridium mobile]MBU5482754.1 chromosome segregation protein SMC [Clostridium mobile]